MKGKINIRLYVIIILIVIYQFSIGLFYCWHEYKTRPDVGFNPFITGYNYIFIPGHESAFGDMNAYNKFAYYLIEKGDFYNPNSGQKSAYVTPGLPLILALIYKICGYNFIPVLFFNSILIALSYYLLYLICLEIFDKKIGYLTLLLSFINIRLSYHLASVLTEFLFIFFITWSIYLFILIFKNKNNRYWDFILLGIILGYDTLVRPVLFPFIIIMIFLLLLNKIKLKYILITLCISFFIISLWLLRNYLLFDSFLFSTSSMNSQLWLNYEAFRNINFFTTYFLPYHSQNDSIIKNALAVCPGDPYFECYWKQASQFFSDWVHNNFWYYIKICVWRFKALLLPYTQDMSSRNSIISTIVWLIISFPTLFVIPKIKKNKYFGILFLLSISLLIMPSLAVVDSYLRYQLPTQFLLIPLASYIWISLYNRIKMIHEKK